MSAEQVAESLAQWDAAEKNGQGPFSASQLGALRAVADSLFPKFEGKDAEELIALIPADATPYERSHAEWAVTHKFSEIPDSINVLVTAMQRMLSVDGFRLIGLVLTVLSTRLGTLALTFYGRPFPDLTVEQRIFALDSWKHSLIPKLRSGAYGLSALINFVALNSGHYVLGATGYRFEGDPSLEVNKNRVKKAYDFKFENVDEYPGSVLETEVLVIGSGATGALVAGELAQAGHKVLVAEKGNYVQNSTGEAKKGMEMYDNSGITASEDFATCTIMGSNFGGGTTVNWSASIPPQHFLRKEWAEKYGLPYFQTPQFQKSVDAVFQRMNCRSDNVIHNKANSILLEGARQFGAPAATLAQNSGPYNHTSGYSTFGCPFNEKQGGKETYLKDAAQNGAKFLINAEVVSLLFAHPRARDSEINPTLSNYKDYLRGGMRTRVIGALLKITDPDTGSTKKAIVRSTKRTVLAAGTFQSPAILMRSNIKYHTIGSNLRLHPATTVCGEFKEPVRQYEGAIMTSVSTIAENVDGDYYGSKLEIITGSVPFTGAISLGVDSPKQWRSNLLRYSHLAQVLVLSRDRESGNIYLDSANKARFKYQVSPHDQVSITEGAVAAAKILIAAGATRVYTQQLGVPEYVAAPNHQGLNDPAFHAFLDAIREAQYKPYASAIVSAHQMGTLRMGTLPVNSATDHRGRLWSARDLYVADASLFPSSSGANPMITCMSLAHSVAQFIKEDLSGAVPQPYL